MRTLSYILLLFLSTSAFGQKATYSKETIFLNGLEKHLLLIRDNNQQVVYTGVFDTHHNLPTGSHYYFDKKRTN